MIRAIRLGGSLVAIGLLIAPARAGASTGLETVHLLALSPAEQAAVLLDSEGALRLVHAGEALPDGAGLLVEVLADRLVVDLSPASPPAAPPEEDEDGTEGGSAGPERAWVYPPTRPGMPARVQRLDSRPPATLPAERLIVPETLPDRLPEGARVARPPAPPPAPEEGPAPASPADDASGDGESGSGR